MKKATGRIAFSPPFSACSFSSETSLASMGDDLLTWLLVPGPLRAPKPVPLPRPLLPLNHTPERQASCQLQRSSGRPLPTPIRFRTIPASLTPSLLALPADTIFGV